MYIVCTAHKTSRISDIKKKRKNKTNYALQLVRYKRIGDMKSWEKKRCREFGRLKAQPTVKTCFE